MRFEVDDAGLLLQVGDFQLNSINADLDEPGCFTLRLPLGPGGALIVNWEEAPGWDYWRLTPEEMAVVRYSETQIRKLMAEPGSWWHLEDPTDGELEVIEALMGAGVIEELEL